MNEAAFLSVVSDDTSYLEPELIREVPHYMLPPDRVLNLENAQHESYPEFRAGPSPVVPNVTFPLPLSKPVRRNPDMKDGYGPYDKYVEKDGTVYRVYKDGTVWALINGEWTEIDKASGLAAVIRENKDGDYKAIPERQAKKEDEAELKAEKKSEKKAGRKERRKDIGSAIGSFAQGLLGSFAKDDEPEEAPPSAEPTAGGGMDPATIGIIAVGGLVLIGGIVMIAKSK